MTNRPIIQLNDISAAYDGKTVLSRVNLNVYEHDFLGVIGYASKRRRGWLPSRDSTASAPRFP